MTEGSSPRTVFAALSDATRLQLIDWVIERGSATATQLAKQLPHSRQAVSQHLAELESAGIFRSVKSGRERHYRFDPSPLVDAQAFLADRTATWGRSLERLKLVVEQATEGETGD